MEKITIMTDSTSDLDITYVESQQIRILPLYVTIGDRTYKDRIELNGAGVFEQVERTGSMPKTSAVPPADYMQAFEEEVSKGNQVIYIGLSSKLSSSFQNAYLAAQEFPEGSVEVVDSKNLSTGIGILVTEAVRMREKGESAATIAEKLIQLTEKVHVEFVIETLEYLHKGGRLSGLQKFLGSMLKIHPLIQVADGQMFMADKLRGSRKKTMQSLLDRAVADKEHISDAAIFVTHAVMKEEAEWLREQLSSQGLTNPIYITEAGSVISSHCGPHTIGIIYLKK
ncbi:DegV family protein [Marinicrinis lubricantis]|uniref:DegV family protein n=1 Tax=Marinicrinis lubricantis TaxID=2086470 RepID=A0ABW1ILB7_9BACL